MSSFFGGKLTFWASLSLSGVAAVIVPVACVAGSNSLGKINTSLSETFQSVNQHLSDSSGQLKEEYVNRGNETVAAADLQTLQNVTGQLHDGGEVAQVAYGYVKENSENINYHFFVFGNLIKSFLSSLPVILRDTIVYNEQTKSDQQLLSVQKMMAIGKMDAFKDFAAKLVQLVQQHHSTLSTMNVKDGRDLINILREIREEDFEQFMKKISANIGKINNSKTYTNATQLLKDVFVGESEMSNLQKQMDELCKQLELKKDALTKGINDLDETKIEKLKELLKKLSSSSSKE